MDSTAAQPAGHGRARRFLSWDAPLLPQAVALLAEGWTGDGPLDLSDLLVIVPTRQSGRRLREALAEHAARKQAAVFPPKVMLPEALMTPAPAAGVATHLESLLAWADVFRSVALDDFRDVFPVDPPARNFAWALRLAEEFVRLQRSLAEAGLQLRDALSRAGSDFPEAERWRQISELETRHEQRLASAGLIDAPAARLRQACTPELPGGVRRIVMLATPDPQPIALQALAALARAVPVEVAVYAPAAEADAFDDWGRPRPETWNTRTLTVPDVAQRVHLCLDPEAQAARIAALAAEYREPEGRLGLGVADSEVLPLLQGELAEVRQVGFNPEGRARLGDQLFQLLQNCARLAREESFATVQALARCPDFLEFLHGQLGPDFSAARFLHELDELHTRHLPPTLTEALQHVERSERPKPDVSSGPTHPANSRIGPALRLIAGLRATLSRGDFPANAQAALAAVFGARRFESSRDEDAQLAEAAETWSVVLQDIAAAAARFTAASNADWWDVALRLYGENICYDEKVAGAIELQGWLELLWEDAPHLVVAGLNDGRVPDAIVGDPFLPESLRERLGLKTNATRFARDAYLLQAIAAWRTGDPGRLDLLFGKTTVAGEPLRPSRLLLRCPDEELPGRIRQLFRPAESTHTTESWRRAWRLQPRIVAPPTRIAVTAIRAWLACPFRFYLSRVLRMEAVDPAKSELDVFDFGTLCHAALEAMGREPALRDEQDAPRLREFLLARLELEAARRFGRHLALPLVVQLESARQRLSRAAEVQALSRAEGWVIEHVERPFEITIGPLVVTGKIDRIDRHERTGARRVLDYKTSDRPVDPEQAHLRGWRREETAPALARFTYNAKEQVWTDLQLPLYRLAVQTDPTLATGGEQPLLECAYFNLPKAIGETGIRPWTDYTRELDDAAWRCANGVAAAIHAGIFWPPNETLRPEQDDFATLFQHGVADSVEWDGAAVGAVEGA
ncbi:PD-(D/E)XK nuclease family protein [Opitutus terrae]|uniref:PD-(D/E)XK nuclease family protein n=1 Tax=Opitutus terrae TaxID=107709 RepID=UPI00030C8917|nr:PD-(D/E)XK nuclease family protein [Opitutus terrae]